MSTLALNNLWESILNMGLSVSNKRWLAQHLIETADREESATLQPYTIEELNERIDRAERDIQLGKVLSLEESRLHRKAHLSKQQAKQTK